MFLPKKKLKEKSACVLGWTEFSGLIGHQIRSKLPEIPAGVSDYEFRFRFLCADLVGNLSACELNIFEYEMHIWFCVNNLVLCVSMYGLFHCISLNM